MKKDIYSIDQGELFNSKVLTSPVRNRSNVIVPKYTSVKAEPHTPPYKIHKYFARRPWNVFNQLIQNFSNEEEIILDPFCGGGVTVYEGIKQNRKVIGCDLNPLSIFIVKNMVKKVVDVENLHACFHKCENYIQSQYKKYNYFEHEGQNIEIAWSEIAFVVKCHYCNSDIVLSNENKLRNGVYRCTNTKCKSNHNNILGVEARQCERNGMIYLFNVGLNARGEKITKPFDANDKKKLHNHLNYLKDELSKNKISIPEDKIPLNWDRQFEDLLEKRGIINFQNLFTERNLLLNILLLNYINSMKGTLDITDFELLRIAFSNTIKDTNIMSFTNDAWQSGKPTTWSKHAYWIPSQFCEVNIYDAFRKSAQRIFAAINYNNKLELTARECDRYKDLLRNCNLLLWNKSVASLELLDNSVDAIITDPPYGSNVQYLELSHFWYPWNKDLYNVEPDFASEAVSNRKKNFDGSKSMYDYENNLYKVFSKSFKVLKPERHMVLTFNNKNVSAWLALLFSIFKSGFTLEKDGIYFQDGVENYKQTAHTKYEGSPYGDFIYVFKKSPHAKVNFEYSSEEEFLTDLHTIFNKHIDKDEVDKNDLIKSMFLEAMPIIENFAKSYLLKNKHSLFSTFKKGFFDHLYA